MSDRGLSGQTTDAEPSSRLFRIEGGASSSLSFIPKDQPDEERFLLRLGFSKPFVTLMRARALENDTSIEAELLASGSVQEDAYYGALARALGLPFVTEIDSAGISPSIALDSQLIEPRVLRLSRPELPPQTLIVPTAATVIDQRHTLIRSHRLASMLAVTTPTAIRKAVWKAGAERRVEVAATALFDRDPELSARSVLTGGQGFLAGFLLMALICCAILYPVATLKITHVGLSFLFCLLIVMRAIAIGRGRPKAIPMSEIPSAAPLPVYTVLVALYREKEVLSQLISSLDRLNWPKSKLDIKLVCEADDRDTIDTLLGMKLPGHFEVVEVPDRAPRTKPKALNYGLAGARGEYLVIYDAEDRPHPDQLLEAYYRFSNAPPELVCLQAPLIIGNAGESWLSALFALEYSGLFRRLLPYLGTQKQPIPLGGTSNHFRIDVLRDVGGWDPYNVTEDADLGMRLYRLGYRSDTLTRYTIEDAPTERKVWLGQRTRWFKGWMQTWLVLMRHPFTLSRELGLGGTLMFHALVTGMLVSALGHPMILIFIGLCIWNLFFAPHTNAFEIGLFAMDWFNVIAAYTVFSRMGWKAMGPHERRQVGTQWRYVPAYWMLMSLAAWKAMLELRSNPFFWNKTPHKARKGSFTTGYNQ